MRGYLKLVLHFRGGPVRYMVTRQLVLPLNSDGTLIYEWEEYMCVRVGIRNVYLRKYRVR